MNSESRSGIPDSFTCSIVAQSPAMLQVIDSARRLASSGIPVLLMGESGTGKKLLARTIHSSSKLADKEFCNVRCTGVDAQSWADCSLTTAEGGTLFLDEVSELPLSVQARVLRILEPASVPTAAIEAEPRKATRYIFATSRALCGCVQDGSFCEDLFYRIRDGALELPSLRERREDIPLLVERFIDSTNRANGTHVAGVTAEAMRLLVGYAWPGNVRQLHRTVEEMVVETQKGMLDVPALPPAIHPESNTLTTNPVQGLAGISLRDIEKEAILSTLRAVNGNRQRAANLLGIGERTLYRKIREYDLRE